MFFIFAQNLIRRNKILRNCETDQFNDSVTESDDVQGWQLSVQQIQAHWKQADISKIPSHTNLEAIELGKLRNTKNDWVLYRAVDLSFLLVGISETHQCT